MTKTLLAVVIIAVALLATASLTIYYLREDNAGQVLWHDNEAYLFMKVARRGYRISYLEYPWVTFKQWLGVPPYRTDESIVVKVIKVTQSHVEYHEVKMAGAAPAPDFYTPIGDTIYANCQGTLCEWAGDRFENATPEEQAKFEGINHLISALNANINGWFKREIGTDSSHPELSIDIEKNKLTLVIKQGDMHRSMYDSPTIDLYRNGQPVEKLWDVNGEPRSVDRKEYVRALSLTKRLRTFNSLFNVFLRSLRGMAAHEIRRSEL